MKKTKLKLTTETIRTLSTTEIREAVGGVFRSWPIRECFMNSMGTGSCLTATCTCTQGQD